MAVLKIYNDIASEDEKIWYSWFGADAVCYKDIDSFCQSIPQDDDEIELRIFCNGGSCIEGWAMYDRLRATGKTIKAVVEGKAASMATILLLAAPKENRQAYENASFCVHNPRVPSAYFGDGATASQLRSAADNLQKEQDRILDTYVARCGCDRDEMQALMDEDKWIDCKQAVELGLIGSTIPPMSAHTKDSFFNNITTSTMTQQDKDNSTAQVSRGWLDKVLAFFGKKTVEEVVFDMVLNTSDGRTLTVEREEGEPQVGDKASPDGTFEMPDGKTIVVEGGVITDIQAADQGGEEGDDGKEDEVTKQTASAHTDEEFEALANQVTALTNERDSLQVRLTEAEANARTKEDLRILNAVKMAGGEKALAKISSNYVPEPRTPSGKNAEDKAVDRKEQTQAILAKLQQARLKK